MTCSAPTDAEACSRGAGVLLPWARSDRAASPLQSTTRVAGAPRL